MNAGTQVRLKSDPGRHGTFTGKKRERAGRTLMQVRFVDGPELVPEDQLEIVTELTEDPLDLLEKGKLGKATDLRRTLAHVRLSGRLANLIYSMEITNTGFYAYQFKPVLKILNSPGNGLLIADEVGLGKTIEAGLIWTELMSRFDLRRLLVLCPAMLRDKWWVELKRRFGINAKILDASNTLSTLQTVESEGALGHFAIICSMQGLRPLQGWNNDDNPSSAPSSLLARYLSEHEHEAPLIDLLVIDEAHYLRNPESKTAALGRLLRNVSDYTLFLSATPVHLRSSDLFRLLNLLDEDTFAHLSTFDNILEANYPLLRAREYVLKNEIKQKEFLELLNTAKQHPLLIENRQLNSLINTPPTSTDLKDPKCRSRIASQLDTMNLFGHVVTRTRKREVHEWKVIRNPTPEYIPLTGAERKFYELVTKIVRDFCKRQKFLEGFLLVTPQRQMSSSMPAALHYWQSKKEFFSDEFLYEDIGIESTKGKIGPLTQELISKVDLLGDLKTLWLNDSKLARLKEVISKILSDNPSEKIVLFSYFRPTLVYLKKRLEELGVECLLIMGGQNINKEAILKEFRASSKHNILLSSEIGSEGIDLEFCRFMINYDLPWNPMRVEQRIGRLDRLGQQSPKIHIWNLFYEDTIDSRIYDRLYKRLKIFEFALGGLEPVLGDKIQKLTRELLRDHLTREEENERIEQTAQAIENIKVQEEQLEKEAAHLVAYGDYILNQVKAAHELNRWISGNDIQVYITDFFTLLYPGCDFKQSEKDARLFDIKLSNDAKHDLDKFIKLYRINHSTNFVRNDPSPVHCRFENKIAIENSYNCEVINQIHPLVRFVSHQIEKSERFYYPAVSVKLNSEHVADMVEQGLYVFTVQKWSVQGLQDIEQLYFAAQNTNDPGSLLDEENAERLVVSAAANGTNWFEAANVLDLKTITDLANEKCLRLSD
ncbi:MAG: helicase, partial [Candidatus Lokiarchaeota archaeon]|nr:helicase [Candidatus Lokiarchaeota archaeon]